jgi:hypothetical protein
MASSGNIAVRLVSPRLGFTTIRYRWQGKSLKTIKRKAASEEAAWQY